MSEPGEGRLRKLGEALSDGQPIDWDAECRETPRIQSTLRRLQQLEALRQAHRTIADSLPNAIARDAAMENAPRPLPGPALFQWGSLQVLELIGEGSFGDVYRALDPQLDREVALKLRRAGLDEANPDTQALLAEARSLARVRHPNVLVVHGADVHDSRFGFWTDLIRGKTLAERLATGGLLGAEEAALVGVSLCGALAAVHSAGFVHGDVKAANVIREDGGRTVLMDFGAASRLGGEPVYGTPLVLAPEVVRGDPPGPSSDLYSLGVLLYLLVTGRYPIEAATRSDLREKHARGDRTPLRDLRPDLPDAFVAAVDRAIQSEPATRFASAGDMERALLASLRTSAESDEEGQTLRSLLEELGRVPEDLCRHIARAAARAVEQVHASNAKRGDIGLETMLLTKRGEVHLIATADPPQGTPREDLQRLGNALFELVTGEAPHPDETGGVDRWVSPFFGAVIGRLRAASPETASLAPGEVVRILNEGEKGLWWKERRQAIWRERKPSIGRIRIPRETALQGRHDELEKLRAAFEETRSGSGRTILIDGEAGIGKTRLVADFVKQLEDEGVTFHFLCGFYPPGGAATATGAFVAAFRDHFGEDMLNHGLEVCLAQAPLLVPPFAALLRGESGGIESGSLTRDSLHTGFVHVTRSLASDRPTILFVDDLHFAPDEGRALFAALSLAAPGHRVLLVGGARPDLPDGWLAGILRQDHASRVTLPRLSPESVTRILAEAYRSERLADDLGPDLATRCDGNPFFLFASLRALEASGEFARREDGQWTVTPAFRRTPHMPSSIRQLIEARLTAMSEGDRELLDVAGCCGFEFDPGLVADALERPLLATLRRFALVEKQHRLIRAAGRRYVFDHHLVQETLYDALFEPLRERYHAALAVALDSREGAAAKDPQGLDGMTAVALCEHYLRGRRGPEGLRYLDAALNHLESSFLNGAAADLAARALRIPDLLADSDRARLILRRASRLGMIGQLAEAEAATREALGIAEAVGDGALATSTRSTLGHNLYRMARYDDALTVLREAQTAARRRDDAGIEANIRNNMGSVYFETGRFDEARVEFEEAAALAHRAGDSAAASKATGNLGILFNALGQYHEAESHHRTRLATARDAGDRLAEANSSGNLGWALMGLGRFDEARACFERLLRLSREVGYRLGEHHAFANLGAVLQQVGLYSEALECLESQLRLCEETGYRQGKPVCLANMSLLFATMGDFERARSNLETAEAMCQDGRFRWFEGSLLQCWGEVEQDAGDLGAAERRYREALELHRALGNDRGVAAALRALGGIEATSDRGAEARAHLEEALRIGREVKSDREIGFAAAFMALLPAGDAAAARETFPSIVSGLSRYEQLKLNQLLWRATGERSYLEDANRLLMTLREGAPARYRDTMFEQVPLYREIRMASERPFDP